MTDTPKSLHIENIKKLVSRLDYRDQPFLYHLPALLEKTDMAQLDAKHAERFVRIALERESLPIVRDALTILNRMLDPQTGEVIRTTQDIFYENRHFFWHELGGHTTARDIITHIFHRTIFFINASKPEE